MFYLIYHKYPAVEDFEKDFQSKTDFDLPVSHW